MFSTMIYFRAGTKSEAISEFRNIFGKSEMLDFQGNYPKTISGCFGSYGDLDFHKTKEFYFCLSTQYTQLEKMIPFFNKAFENIQIEIVDQVELIEISTRFGDRSEYTKEYYEKLIKPNKSAIEYKVNLLHISFSDEYDKLTKYILTIPLGFFTRMFCTYYNLLDIPDMKGNNPIKEALDLSNSKPGYNGGYISDYPFVRYNTFMAMDDVTLMNKLFSKPTEAWYKGITLKLDFDYSIKPYCVYSTIDLSLYGFIASSNTHN